MPSMTVIAPTARLALPTDKPAARLRKVGIQAEIPPMAKVRVASPKVAVRKAGFRNKPRTVERVGEALTWSLAPRTGSRPRPM